MDEPWGAPENVAALVDLFRLDPNASQVMKIARRANLPWSEVADRWSDEDLMRELAWDALEGEDRAKRCHRCGVAPDEMLGDNGRPAAEPAWKFVVHDCAVCNERAELDDGIRARSDKYGKTAHVKVVPRTPGESMELDLDGG